MLVSLLLACTDPSAKADDSGTVPDDTGDPATTGVEIPACAVVTDIDETLTTDDLEFVYQVADPDYDPEMRPDANTLFAGYADLGYTVVYLTGRGEGLSLSDGTSARDATDAWLDAHGFPRSDGDLYLADSDLGLSGEEAHTYKTGVLTALEDAGWTFQYAYGNAEADIEAYQDAGIPSDDTFLVGDLAGTMQVGAISNEDAYTLHLDTWLPTVPTCD